MTTPIQTKIEQNAKRPARASGDGWSAEQHPLPDQIAADRYARGADVTTKAKTLGFRMVKLVPPGTV